ncbi:DNA-binding transcriptional response regulator, NtrC family, contains REC, AAA-type ATPase, and a Fis-type DNA-binding domains [Aequorivita viscosa]|uniref:DNA-binding transcriptional response regulator, NtrC family, contains REC, AAA-type ATPase, and a Fis-type DNA-binding domains n=2 Tax=Aequorivita viscosa TaxID=797419 RepID=A0A1M6I339_9FLAO|nr:DNA-binding transcriptional response regulator, NtrC family, contains REC, AAA-type ATPase, and a Fis-type DNA-binding domains [Aequorivita viscosa]SHJ28815.1 DNA-binding transcriptional response regulator, NtrC family, contains REC, AAA-type ATPase, and a Fis-type DNA-binding domains [Aequorivita viscosa]
MTMLQKENILIVDDDIGILELIQRHLHSMDYHTFKAVSVKEAVAILRDTEIDLLITDLKMPEVDGFELIQFVSEHYPNIPKLVVTGYPSIQDALSAIKSRVVDYLVKPFTKAELKQAVQKSLSSSTKKKSTDSATSLKKYDEIIGESKQVRNVIQIIDRVKDNKATVYISGESGTGKELVARSIHYNGKFSREPFIAVNCGGIPENLLESELFGYIKGAFTGAEDSREGFFQAAEGGTIFLDEIGNASLGVQSRLLRVLQEKEVVKVGARKSEKIDLRVIAATNSDLKEMVAKETFREDLYYRLTVVEIHVPPLRERKEDIPLLADKFLFKYGNEYKGRYVTIDTEAKELITRYDWPGNIRELENVIQRAVIMCDRTIGIKDLPESLKYQIDFPKEGLLPLKELERQYIQKVLAATNNNQTKAAEILQIDRKTLRAKIREI